MTTKTDRYSDYKSEQNAPHMGIYRLSIDPGLSGTGVALWRDDDCGGDGWHRIEEPVRTGILGPQPGGPQVNAEQIVRKLRWAFGDLLITAIGVEWPAMWMTPVAFAASQKGDIHKLTYLIGRMDQMFYDCLGIHMELINVNDWKGQLKKEVVAERINDLFGNNYLTRRKVSSHAIDAVGIGLYMKGHRFQSGK